MAYRHAAAAVLAERRSLDGGPQARLLLATAEAHRLALDGVLLRAHVGTEARDEAQGYWRQGRRQLAALSREEPQEGLSMGNGAAATNRGQGVARSAGKRGYITAPGAATSASTSAPQAASAPKTASSSTSATSATPRAQQPQARAQGTAKGAQPKSAAASQPKVEKASPGALAYVRANRPAGSSLHSLGGGQYRLSMPDAQGVLQHSIVSGAMLNSVFKTAQAASRSGARSSLRAAGKASTKAAGLDHLKSKGAKTAGQIIHHDTSDLWRTFRQSHDIVRKIREHF